MTDNAPMKRKKKTRKWLPFLILLMIAGGVFLFTRYRQQQSVRETLANLRTEPLSRETLRTTISGTGSVRPQQSAILLWQTSGTVWRVEVEVNQEVESYDPLITLDPNKLSPEMMQADLNVLTAQQALDSLEESTDLQRVTLNNNIQQARQNLLTLETQLLNFEGRVCEDWRLSNLQRDYDNAFEEYQNFPNETRWFAVQAARQALDYCDPIVIELQIANLQSQIDLAEQNILQWEADLDEIKEGVNQKEKARLELQLAVAVKTSQSQKLSAPFDGTILAINQKVGDLVSPGTQAIEIADMRVFYVDVPVSEVDVPTINLGQKAQLSFDAYYDEIFEGEVTAIAESGNRSTGVVNYLVTIKMNETSPKIKPGMTAGVQILTEEKANVLVVPSEAVFIREGQDHVYVLRNGELVDVPIKVGGYSNRLVELMEADIREGEMIVLNPPANLFDRFGPPNRMP